MKTIAFAVAYVITCGLLIAAVIAAFNLPNEVAVICSVPVVMLLRPIGRWTGIHVLGED